MNRLQRIRSSLRVAARVLLTAAACALPVERTAVAQDDATAAADALAKSLFMTGAVPPCALCHALKEVGATGAVGPVLDDLQPDATRVATALRTGIGAMPSYKATLSEAQIVLLSRYVAKASGGAR